MVMVFLLVDVAATGCDFHIRTVATDSASG
jgi:hypothetical protein